jgi:hypothetical protein
VYSTVVGDGASGLIAVLKGNDDFEGAIAPDIRRCKRANALGGAFFFSSLDTHRYQVQRHARKAGARAFCPAYRLAPQYPFVSFDLLFHFCFAWLSSSRLVGGDRGGVYAAIWLKGGLAGD